MALRLGAGRGRRRLAVAEHHRALDQHRTDHRAHDHDARRDYTGHAPDSRAPSTTTVRTRADRARPATPARSRSTSATSRAPATASTNSKPNQSVIIILLLTVLAIAPALMVMLTSFTRIVIVLSLTRNALGLTSIPPNQVVIGLALFLSLFVMAPTLTQDQRHALQPLLKGKISYGQAYDEAQSRCGPSCSTRPARAT